MGKDLKERLSKTIKRDKQEINEENNRIELNGKKEINVEDFMNKKIKEIIGDEQNLKEGNESDDFQEDFKEEFEEKLSNEKKVIIILLTLIISLSTILILWSNGSEIVNFAFNKVSKLNEEKNLENQNELVEIEEGAMDLTQCYSIIHNMSNTIIIADDEQIWGENEITKESVTQMVNELKGRDDYLLDKLKKWLELDFSNGVEVHNYVWDKLDGNIGKAKDLNEEKIKQVIKSMKE